MEKYEFILKNSELSDQNACTWHFFAIVFQQVVKKINVIIELIRLFIISAYFR